MRKINEEFLHFLWKNQQLTGIQLTSPGVERIRVIDPGLHNHDAGPDFFNARVEIDGTLWAGNVEIHINASDWIRHGHPGDPAYNSVILHVVCFNDCEITRSDGEPIPAAMLRFPKVLWDTYDQLMKSNHWIPCQDYLDSISPLQVAQWTSSLMVEKLKERSEMLSRNMEDLNGHWDAVLSRMIFRSFGLPVNTTPFEMLALTIPHAFLLRYRNDLFALESALLGKAGMLDTAIAHDQYTESLRQEYHRHKNKLETHAVPHHLWKYLRMRPSAFPSLRLAQLASLIHARFPFLHHLLKQPGIDELSALLRVRAGDYWNTHYQPGRESKSKPKFTGKAFIQTVIINALAPFAFFYGKSTGQQSLCDYATGLLEQLPPENNGILKKWGRFGIAGSNAFESQALLFLFRSYCCKQRCLECQFGNTVLLEPAMKSK